MIYSKFWGALCNLGKQTLLFNLSSKFRRDEKYCKAYKWPWWKWEFKYRYIYLHTNPDI